MPNYGRSTLDTDLLSRLRRVGVVAVIRAPSASLALQAVDALVAGGVTGIEITYSTPDAPSVIAEVDQKFGDQVLLGAGTVLTARQADDAVNAGATFLVSPGTTPAVANAMKQTGAAVMMGVMTPSELMQAIELGADVVKLFPASMGGVALLRSFRGPFPTVPIMPTGGVNPGNLGAWLAAGAIAVGAGGELCSTAHMRDGRWSQITELAATFAGAFRVATAD